MVGVFKATTLAASLLCSSIAKDLNILHLTDIHFDDDYAVGSAAHCDLGSTGLGCCHRSSVRVSEVFVIRLTLRMRGDTDT